MELSSRNRDFWNVYLRRCLTRVSEVTKRRVSNNAWYTQPVIQNRSRCIRKKKVNESRIHTEETPTSAQYLENEIPVNPDPCHEPPTPGQNFEHCEDILLLVSKLNLKVQKKKQRRTEKEGNLRKCEKGGTVGFLEKSGGLQFRIKDRRQKPMKSAPSDFPDFAFDWVNRPHCIMRTPEKNGLNKKRNRGNQKLPKEGISTLPESQRETAAHIFSVVRRSPLQIKGRAETSQTN